MVGIASRQLQFNNSTSWWCPICVFVFWCHEGVCYTLVNLQLECISSSQNNWELCSIHFQLNETKKPKFLKILEIFRPPKKIRETQNKPLKNFEPKIFATNECTKSHQVTYDKNRSFVFLGPFPMCSLRDPKMFP